MSDGTCISLDMLVSVGSHGNIKPEEVVSILVLDFGECSFDGRFTERNFCISE